MFHPIMHYCYCCWRVHGHVSVCDGDVFYPEFYRGIQNRTQTFRLERVYGHVEKGMGGVDLLCSFDP